MSLFTSPEAHAANPPETWTVDKRSERRWVLCDKSGMVFGDFTTKREAEKHLTSGFYVTLYEQERRWYAGEPVPNWRPYAEVKAEDERRAARWGSK